MTNTEKLFATLVKQVKLNKISTVLEVENQVDILCEKFGIILTQEQKNIFVKAFCKKYIIDDIDSFFEEPEDEAEKIRKKIEIYKAKLLENPENKISIQSMISKLRKKLRDLGYEVEMTPRTQAKSIKILKAKLEQLELDLALAPMQKRKSVQSMISKIKKQLRDLGDTEFIKQPKIKIIKPTPAELIGLNELDFDTFINTSCLAAADSEPFNKLIIITLLKYSKQNNIDLQELAKFVLKYMKNKFTNFCLPDNKFISGNVVASLIENQTIKNLAKGIKSIRSLTISELISLDLLNIDLSNIKLLKKISKCQSINDVKKFLK